MKASNRSLRLIDASFTMALKQSRSKAYSTLSAFEMIVAALGVLYNRDSLRKPKVLSEGHSRVVGKEIARLFASRLLLEAVEVAFSNNEQVIAVVALLDDSVTGSQLQRSTCSS